MSLKNVQISQQAHQNLRKEAADLGVQIKKLAEVKIRKPLSKDDIKHIKSK